jgi:hypothetical protein
MNATGITLLVVGIFLVVVGVVLLVVKVQAFEGNTFRPIFQGPGRVMVSGPVGLVVIVIGVFCLILSIASYRVAGSGNSANPPPSSSNPTVSPSISSTHTSPSPSSSPSLSATSPSGAIIVPPSGANNVYAFKNLQMSGSARNIPKNYRLDLFLQFVGVKRYYAAGDPNKALSFRDGAWKGAIYIGEPKPIIIWLVSLSPSKVRWMNSPRQGPYQNGGFPSLPGSILASATYTAK